ncbi:MULTISPECIES: bacterioferritin [Marichromatium]|uniref:Bacterioferritin n=1 Tax=Marichromatium gracile TaxID=1048 RepID=A0A4R4A9H6_MARGR|nr:MULTISPECIES: bacterioferritin [Marichromatium]MBK1708518.1 bacterioferritin [Marichromatium gracile]RNE89929.1 bacterioferritin [Marichromatium sp. AB31]RNE94194.1 bacterioferritin [Marichromatium sp. AB32]TCW35592.1 bacterioferritin [Marichromatium gracile]
MKIDPAMNRQLNAVIKEALTAINQSFLHARMLGHWGFPGIEKRLYDYSILAMRQADRLIERVLFLEGLPNLQDLGKLHVGEDVPEQLAAELELGQRYRTALGECAARAEQLGDYVSRALCESLNGEVEEQIDWLETQHALIDELGLERYLETQV